MERLNFKDNLGVSNSKKEAIMEIKFYLLTYVKFFVFMT